MSSYEEQIEEHITGGGDIKRMLTPLLKRGSKTVKGGKRRRKTRRWKRRKCKPTKKTTDPQITFYNPYIIKYFVFIIYGI